MHRFRREPESEFELRVDAIGGVLGLNVRGSLAAAGDQLHACFEKAVRGGRPVVLDLSEVSELGAAGLKTLMDGHRMLATRLRIVIERGGPVHEAIRREGVAHVLALHGSRVEALAASGG
jgi:anti-sigma B factor antagonist